MDTILSILVGVLAFVTSFVPTLGSVVHYRMADVYRMPKAEATVLFGGDVMLDRSIRVAMREHGEDFIFSCLGDTLHRPDLTIINLEGPITERESVSIGSAVGDAHNTKFTFAPTTAALLKRQGIDVVSLANNHAQDFGPSGVRSTMQYLSESGVAYFGDPHGESEYRTRVHGVPLAFIGYNDFQLFDGYEWQSSSTTMQKVRDSRAAGYLPIVFAHWGPEYVEPTTGMRALAHALIDNGAELVIGAHPHVVQEHEEYAGKHIYYSLGNFIFDQYFSEAVRNGLLVEVRVGTGGVEDVREIPVRLERDRRTCLAV